MDMDEPQRELSGDEHDSKRSKTDGDDDASSTRRREPLHVSEEELHDQRFRAGALLPVVCEQKLDKAFCVLLGCSIIAGDSASS